MDSKEKIKMAYTAILQHDFERAVYWFEQAIAEQPEVADYHYRLSITQARNNKLEQSYKSAQQAVQLDPTHATYRFHLNHLTARRHIEKAKSLLEDVHHPSEAIVWLNRAITLDPLAQDAFLLKGMAHANLKEYNQAVRALKDALRLNPQYAQARRLLEALADKIG